MYSQIILAGVLVSLLFTELTGLSAGLIVPGYLALSLHSPLRLVYTLLISAAAMAICRLLSQAVILYGRRRYFVFLAVGMLAKLALGMSGSGAIGTIGYLIPGLLGRDMERQGILKTLASATIVTVFIVLGGMVLGVAWL